MRYTDEQLQNVDEWISRAGVLDFTRDPLSERGALSILNGFIQDGVEILLCSDDPESTENPRIYVEEFREGKFKDSLGEGDTLSEALLDAAVNYCDRR